MGTGVAFGLVTKGNGEVILTREKHTSLSTGGGQAGQGYPAVLVLNDQGGGVMNISYDVTATLRSQTKHHEPVILDERKETLK